MHKCLTCQSALTAIFKVSCKTYDVKRTRFYRIANRKVGPNQIFLSIGYWVKLKGLASTNTIKVFICFFPQNVSHIIWKMLKCQTLEISNVLNVLQQTSIWFVSWHLWLKWLLWLIFHHEFNSYKSRWIPLL